MTRSLYSCWFDAERNDYYRRMANVLDKTARRHCPDWMVWVERLQCSRRDAGTTAANTKKLDWWTDRVTEAQDGDEVLLIDSDCMITGPIDDVWGQDFDVAITRRESDKPYPYNGGVAFLRISERTRLFMQTWAAVNRKLRDNPPELSRWRKKYGGMNQAALGAILESGIADPLDLKLVELPCRIWNCEDSAWKLYGPETRIVHYKSGLRIAALAIGAGRPDLSGLVQMWRRLDREVNR